MTGRAEDFSRTYTDAYEIGDAALEAANLIEMMREDGPRYPGLDLGAHTQILKRAITTMREQFLEEDDDMRRRAAAEGSLGKPFRKRSTNWIDDESCDEQTHDYSAWQPADPDEEWEEFWDENYAKKISAKTGKRARNPGWFRELGNGGKKMMKPPLVSVYFLCNRFFRRVLRIEFYPIFNANDHSTSDLEALPHLNAAARFFLLMAQAADPGYTREHCKRVHDDCYHDLGTEGRKISHHRL